MSLYNMLFGVNAAAPVLLAMLGIDPDDVPRFRDCYLDEEKNIVIYTRTGGGNRPYYENAESYKAKSGEEPDGRCWNDDLRKLPGFIDDCDDDFDCTYAYFKFKVPEKFAHLIEKLPEGVDPAKRWQETLDNLRTATPDDPVLKKLDVALRPMFDAMAKGESGVFKV